MKKKSARKVNASKKPILKAKQKIKKPSLLPWLIAGLLIFASVGYWYFQAKPQSIKILQIAGTIEDYMSPVPVDINIVTAGRKLPMSDTPEVNAMVAANQVIREAVKSGKKPEDVEAEAERAAVQAARDTYVQLGNTPQGQSSTTTAPTVKPPTTQEIIKKANEDAAVAMSTLKNVTYTKVGEDVIAKTNGAPAGGGSGAGCPTVAGFSAGVGQTMIGDTDGTNDRVYECKADGSWKYVCTEDKTKEGQECLITVKPMYLTEGKNLNCTSGGVVIGDDTVDKAAGKICKDGVLEDAPKAGGVFKTPEEIAKLKDTCIRNGGGWTDDNTCGVGKESCERGGGFWNGKICDKNRGSIAEFDCTKQGSAYKWDNSTKKCVETPKVGANTFSKQDVCEGTLKDKTKETCIRSTDNPNLWMVVPKGTTTANSGVSNTTSSEINKPTTSTTTFKSGADCDRAKTQGFTCEPIAGGNYYKLTPVSELPAPQQREFVADAQGNFGSSVNDDSRVDDKKYSWIDCNRDLPAGQECVREVLEEGQGVGSFYRIYKSVTTAESNPNDNQNSDKEKAVGDKCSGSLIWGDCERCPGGMVSKVSDISGKKWEYYCGNSDEVNSIVNAGYSTMQSDQPAPLVVVQSNLPSTGTKVVAATGTGATAGAIAGAVICGGISALFGAATFGAGFIITPAVVGTCAAWGAGVGALTGGTAAYVSTSNQPSSQSTESESVYSRPNNVEPTYVEGPSANSTERVYQGPDGLYNDSYCESNDECASGYCKPYNFVNNPRSHCDDPD